MSPSFIERERRRQIIAAAISVIASEGYAAASLSRIAQEAGISKSIISYHFAGKDELFEQVFATVAEAAGAAMAPHLERAGSAAERVAAYIRHQILYMAGHRAELLAIGHLAVSHGGAAGPPYIAEAGRQEAEMLRAWFAEGQAGGEFRMFDTDVMAITLASAVEGVLTRWAWHPETDLAAMAEELVSLFHRAMRHEP